jgi:hypothetical protein
MILCLHLMTYNIAWTSRHHVVNIHARGHKHLLPVLGDLLILKNCIINKRFIHLIRGSHWSNNISKHFIWCAHVEIITHERKWIRTITVTLHVWHLHCLHGIAECYQYLLNFDPKLISVLRNYGTTFRHWWVDVLFHHKIHCCMYCVY